METAETLSTNHTATFGATKFADLTESERRAMVGGYTAPPGNAECETAKGTAPHLTCDATTLGNTTTPDSYDLYGYVRCKRSDRMLGETINL